LQKEYKTVLHGACAEIEEKKSRFIATVKPVATEEEAIEFISSMKTKYWDATHNVYAYYIGGKNVVQRFSDDGEPSGTAGMPVLEVIKRMGVQDVAVVVTRYFGGTLLGASGLIRAYSKSASAGLEAATVIRRQLCIVINVIVEYTIFGKIQSMLIAEGYAVKDTIYGQDVEIIVYVPVDDVDKFTALIIEATNDRALVEVGEKVYVTFDDNGKIIDADMPDTR